MTWRRPFTPEEYKKRKERALELLLDGLAPIAVSIRLGVQRSTVWDWAKEANIPCTREKLYEDGK